MAYPQGNRVLTEQDFEEVIVPPAGLRTFALDACFQAGFPLQQVVGYLPQGCHVLGPVIQANPALVLPTRYIQAPVQRALDAPVGPRCPQTLLNRTCQAC